VLSVGRQLDVFQCISDMVIHFRHNPKALLNQMRTLAGVIVANLD
jgi:hypothetical protein